MINDARHGVLYAGMYAPSEVHRAAWRDWFSILSEQNLKQYYSSLEISFAVNDQIYFDENLIAAQSCGYPFITRWANSHQLLAVPVFDIQGSTPKCTIGSKRGQYCSWFISSAQNTAQSLAQFEGKRIAINNETSNSGMNVLRYAISQFSSSDSFFCERIISGSHQQSMQLVAKGRADIAAIDVISYALIADLEPALVKQLKIVGQSVLTMGLPFIFPKQSGVKPIELCDAMNIAVKQMPPESRKRLHLTGFETASRSDYEKIAQLEKAAVTAAYPVLR